MTDSKRREAIRQAEATNSPDAWRVVVAQAERAGDVACAFIARWHSGDRELESAIDRSERGIASRGILVAEDVGLWIYVPNGEAIHLQSRPARMAAVYGASCQISRTLLQNPLVSLFIARHYDKRRGQWAHGDCFYSGFHSTVGPVFRDGEDFPDLSHMDSRNRDREQIVESWRIEHAIALNLEMKRDLELVLRCHNALGWRLGRARRT